MEDFRQTMTEIMKKVRYIGENFTEFQCDTHDNDLNGLDNRHHSPWLHDFGRRHRAWRPSRDRQRATQLLRAASQAGRRAVSAIYPVAEQAEQVISQGLSPCLLRRKVSMRVLEW